MAEILSLARTGSFALCRLRASLYGDFAAAVEDLEVGSASAAGVERKEIGSFFYWSVKDDFGEGNVGFQDASARDLDVGTLPGVFVETLL